MPVILIALLVILLTPLHLQAGIAGRKGLSMVICNYAAMTSMVKTLGVFRTETALITRERAAGLYSVGVCFVLICSVVEMFFLLVKASKYSEKRKESIESRKHMRISCNVFYKHSRSHHKNTHHNTNSRWGPSIPRKWLPNCH